MGVLAELDKVDAVLAAVLGGADPPVWSGEGRRPQATAPHGHDPGKPPATRPPSDPEGRRLVVPLRAHTTLVCIRTERGAGRGTLTPSTALTSFARRWPVSTMTRGGT